MTRLSDSWSLNRQRWRAEITMENKVILITGSSSGFGNLTAKTLAMDGHKVYATMKNSEGKNAESAKTLSGIENINVLDLDVTDDNSVNKTVKKIIEAESKIDVVVNNAGITGAGITEAFTIEQVKQIFDVNTLGPLRVIRAVLPQMRKQKSGLIIQISSRAGRVVMPFIGAYTASKFAIEAITQTYSTELQPLGIESVIIEPGDYPTEIINKVLTPEDKGVLSEYGEMARAPEKMFEGFGEMFKNPDAPKPQLIADAVKKLVDMEPGKRPLRTVVDAMFGQVVKELNKASEKSQEEIVKVFSPN
ncbi:MAG: SDR family oxidoreductase [Thaumarchaeota archaeon]|nr:SDR family oxidoreductase [Nitrososphaerota archaeon]